MKMKLKNFPYIDNEIEINQQRPINPYYNGGRINTLNFLSNKIYSHNTGKRQKIRLYSTNNSFLKYKNKYSSNDKLKLLNDINNSNQPIFQAINTPTINSKQGSVNLKNQNIKNFSLFQKNNKSMGMGKRLYTELNYPSINLNMAYGQSYNLPLYRKRRIFFEEDNDLAEEYEKLRKIWDELGVTSIYIDNFEAIINNENNSKEEIMLNLRNEQKQMIKFKEDIKKVVAEILKRENDIKNIIELDRKYLEIKTKIYLSPKKNIKNNNSIKGEDLDIKENNENNNKTDKKDKINEQKNKIEEEIEKGLNCLRLHGINVVSTIKRFNMKYDHLLNSGKIDVNYLKKEYGFDNNYLMKLKTDLDFLKGTDIGDLYHFSEKGKDPFLISISMKLDTEKKYKILPISEEMMVIIKSYNYLLNEIEIFSIMKNDYERIDTLPNNFNHTYKYGGLINGINKNDSNAFDSKLKISNNNFITPKIKESKISFNSTQQVPKLKNKKSEFSIKPLKRKSNQDTIGLDDKNSQNLNEFENLKKNLTGPCYAKLDNTENNNKIFQIQKIQNNNSDIEDDENPENQEKEIVKEVQTRVNIEVVNKLAEVEDRIKKQIEEKLKKEKERLEEEEKRLKIEKEKIEEMRKIEEEKRIKEKEKWEKIEQERIKKEEEERKRIEEEEKLQKEENERIRKEIEDKFLLEIEQKFKKEEDDRKKKEEENNLMKKELGLKIKEELEEERKSREKDEKAKNEMKEKIRLEEIEKIRNDVRKNEFDRIRREEIDKIQKEREDRLKKDEEERKRKEEEERMRREIERLKRENEERIQKEKEEKKKREQEEKERKEKEKKLYEEIERLKKEEIKRINLEKEIE